MPLIAAVDSAKRLAKHLSKSILIGAKVEQARGAIKTLLFHQHPNGGFIHVIDSLIGQAEGLCCQPLKPARLCRCQAQENRLGHIACPILLLQLGNPLASASKGGIQEYFPLPRLIQPIHRCIKMLSCWDVLDLLRVCARVKVDNAQTGHNHLDNLRGRVPLLRSHLALFSLKIGQANLDNDQAFAPMCQG